MTPKHCDDIMMRCDSLFGCRCHCASCELTEAVNGNLRNVEIVHIGLDGLFHIRVWRTARGWSYDGPASGGPEAVRTSGRGPHWTGDVEELHVVELVKRATALDVPVRLDLLTAH